MTLESKARAATVFLSALTVPRVALGLALAAGGVILWNHWTSPTPADKLLVVEMGLAALGVAIAAGIWSKIDGANSALVVQWRMVAEGLEAQVKELKAEVAKLQNEVHDLMADRAEIRAQLAACLERDRSAQTWRANVTKQLSEQRSGHSGFGDLPS